MSSRNGTKVMSCVASTELDTLTRRTTCSAWKGVHFVLITTGMGCGICKRRLLKKDSTSTNGTSYVRVTGPHFGSHCGPETEQVTTGHCLRWILWPCIDRSKLTVRDVHTTELITPGRQGYRGKVYMVELSIFFFWGGGALISLSRRAALMKPSTQHLEVTDGILSEQHRHAILRHQLNLMKITNPLLCCQWC